MSLIYPEEAWARFGPAPIITRDARGCFLRFVVACDPLTGEVIQNVRDTDWVVPVVRRVAIIRDGFLRPLFTRYSSLRPRGSIVTRHYFAPAPLTISRVEGP